MHDRGMPILQPIRSHKMLRRAIVIAVFAGVLVLDALHSAAQDGKQLVSDQILNKIIPSPLTDQLGEAERGRRIVLDRKRGDCVVCHALPLPERQFHGTVGLPLDGVGNRYTAGALRLRLVDPKALNPQTIMPAYHQVQRLYQVLERYRGKPILTAQEIEDVIAYLLTLRKEPTNAAHYAKTQPTFPSHAQQDSGPYVVAGRRSGYTYLSQENQALQDDEFGNPGMLWVERGRELWAQTAGASQRSCASCHGDTAASMRGTRARYPRFDPRWNKLINLEQQINHCRQEHIQVATYPYESAGLLALSAFVSFQSHGLPVNVPIAGPAKPFFEAGKEFFLRRRGQLDMACTHCHDQQTGQRLRGDVISQGQINGFPIYRHTWQTLGSTHRMFAWCNAAIRAEPLPHGADDYVNLELYLAWRGRGLPLETPAVRR
jgi:L-cysteine S-thiosulfotransferase